MKRQELIVSTSHGRNLEHDPPKLEYEVLQS